MEFLQQYGLFLAKSVTLIVAIAAAVGLVSRLAYQGRKPRKGHLEVRCLNKAVEEMVEVLAGAMLAPTERKKAAKAKMKAGKQADKERAKLPGAAVKKRIYVVDFDGDLRASAVDALREEITVILTLAADRDEVVVRLESSGGMVHGYGLAASQLDRVKNRSLALTICVDKVAASGGYMMACVADNILAAPFAVIGSIGVVAQIPNINRLLKRHDIDVELMTAGKYKRTLTVLGENTDQGREKFREELEDTHRLFKDFVSAHRPAVDIDKVATGEVWFGTHAKALGLVDRLQTSDDYLVSQFATADIYEVAYVCKQSLSQRIGLAIAEGSDHLLMRLLRYWNGPTRAD